LIVELMRQGRTPQEACEEAVRRLISKNRKDIADIQAGFLAINKEGQVGAFAVQPGFNFAKATLSNNELIDSKSHF